MRNPYHTFSLKDRGAFRKKKQKERKAQRQQVTIGKQGLVDTLGYTHELTEAVPMRAVENQDSQLKHQPGKREGFMKSIPPGDTIGN